MKSITITPNASVIVAFDSADARDKAYKNIMDSTPREFHGRVRSGGGDDDEKDPATLSIRIQHVSTPITINLDGTKGIAPPTLGNSTGTPSAYRLQGLEHVPGANAANQTHLAPKSSGVNLTEDVPGAVNNDPSTATNAGYEGSPAQAIQAAQGNGPGTPTPGGFVGPDKADPPEGVKPSTEKEKPDKDVIKIHKEAAKAEKEAAKEKEAAAK